MAISKRDCVAWKQTLTSPPKVPELWQDFNAVIVGRGWEAAAKSRHPSLDTLLKKIEISIFSDNVFFLK